MLKSVSHKAIVRFHYMETLPNFSNKTSLKKFLKEICTAEQVKISRLDVIFCTDEYLLSINEQHLHHSYYTDIITFNLADENAPIIGEIYISIDRVTENAVTLLQPFEKELHRVIFHGVLHLCGYTDKTVQQKKQMRKAEDKYLILYFAS